MCLGIPMKVVEVAGPGRALCANGDVWVEIDTLLVGDVAPGEWLMTFLGAAREKMDEVSALRSRDALSALEAIMNGGEVDIEAAFADLIDREPQLPEHLRSGAPN
ncbi:HypC/HybG/HupF family hydrogenase formation chaperone [Novosphingobium decolorationis]|uniref:HypC/HybG/HupF family hydrogenase formation chaperone n=1 Tax=Novosphingobium decolorationis TaxID=2698673 RepID=A0ABX8EA96_9SPHN|nr:HypC/HybG/HupF family hydrogenase formation chaperone [Novosphingobium decolorationis]QVM85130.1 HypC/HybG/HupF family hydrogenase formation chaperone [Novosphingobium decolorationis]